MSLVGFAALIFVLFLLFGFCLLLFEVFSTDLFFEDGEEFGVFRVEVLNRKEVTFLFSSLRRVLSWSKMILRKMLSSTISLL